MTSLEDYKEQYVNQSIQFVVIDFDGVIVESDQTFMHLDSGGFIYDIHPFFISYTSVLDSPDDTITYNCVHIDFNEKELITDVKMIKKNSHILLVIYDLTDHYLSYQAIAQARNESIINSELMVLKNIELEERERFKNTFIQNFSHELRNPLTSVISITNVIEGTELSNDQQRMVSFLKESNANLKLLLNDIMSISMISSGKLQLRNKEFSLYRLLELVEFTYKTKAAQKSLKFIMNRGKKVPEFVEGDRLRLFQVITNLLDNALKFTNEGNIGLTVKVNQKRANKVSLRFEVYDSGIGISEEKLDAIFESFTKLESEGKNEGSGLGLSIVKGLAELMGSNIRVTSELGSGAKFFFDLTLKFQLDLASKPVVKKPDARTKPLKKKLNRKYRLLLVEDDERIQTVLFKSLMDTNLFFIDLVNDGALVFEEVMNNTYDIILMDIDLPNVQGDQITKLIREFPFKNIKHIPIIGITANAYEENIKDYLAKGMNTVITKPFDLQELLNTVQKYLKK
ncbi:hybrid sensor histidine kinase/response regulator [Maribacter sp. HTCC2170]|uniref:hybrid sensor histidine kinase/response regulator n=1 Tax=Maribacter sp. (strain HTCC2170 / KCCM 42371) TaxID=313603 RepID=UPI00006BD407|nr:ATP-binding protein [Maribacter sp. HTCC2170]EAR02530.1 multi-sensor hybrid histidine kinase [Maribacter sp. HTCC2170]